MSTDLQLPQELPELRLSAIKIKPDPAAEPETSDQSCTIQSEQQRLEEEEEVDECTTPKSPEHRIPVILSCPPPPKKQRHSAPSCKRRLCEFQFFEIVAGEEVESFFKSSYEFINNNENSNYRKRRCAL